MTDQAQTVGNGTQGIAEFIDLAGAERFEAEAYRLEQEAPLRAEERTSITDDAFRTTVAPDPPVRRRRIRAWFLLSLPVVFVAAGVGGWFLFGR